jgi:hypothetical protein
MTFAKMNVALWLLVYQPAFEYNKNNREPLSTAAQEKIHCSRYGGQAPTPGVATMTTVKNDATKNRETRIVPQNARFGEKKYYEYFVIVVLTAFLFYLFWVWRPKFCPTDVLVGS